MMSDEKIRRRMHSAADACLSGVENMPSQRAAVLRRMDTEERKRGFAGGRKISYSLVFAALLLTLAGAAVAAGLGLFGQLRVNRIDEMSYERLAHLEEAAVVVGQSTTLEELGELTISQAYCDGRKLYYSYTLRKNDASEPLYVGDGAELADGTYLAPVDSWISNTDGATTEAYYEVALPDAYAAGESVEVVLRVFAGGQREQIRVQVTAPVTDSVKAFAGESTADGYLAMAELYVSDVDVAGSVRITAPEDYWPKGYVLEAGGAEYQDIEGWSRYDGKAHVVQLRFDLPASLEDMKLVPLDGEYAHEAIGLSETKGE